MPLRIPEHVLTKEIKQTQTFKYYEADYAKIAVSLTQPQPVRFTQEMHRTPSATRTPKTKRESKKKKKHDSDEPSQSKKTLKLKLITRNVEPITRVPSAAEVEKAQMTEAQELSLAIHKSAEEHEAQVNVQKGKKALLHEKVEQLVEGTADDDVEFANSLILSQEAPGTRIEPVSHKERPEEKESAETDNDDHDDHALIRERKNCSSETRKEQKQTTIPTPTRSTRDDLSSDKTFIDELMESDVPMPDKPSSSKPSFENAKHFHRVLSKVTKRRNNVIKTLKKHFISR